MPEVFLYLTTIGNVTKLERTIEIWYVELDGRYYLVSEMRLESKWVKNILRTPEVWFSLGSSTAQEAVRARTKARARLVASSEDLAESVKRSMDEKYGWSDGVIVELCPE